MPHYAPATAPEDRNLISGNSGNGLGIRANPSGANVTARVEGNLIGTDKTGSAALPNALNGIEIFAGSVNCEIGGTNSNEANIIAFNGERGVRIGDGTHSVLGNSIFSNGSIGIDLFDFSSAPVTPNDNCDTDTGANNLQNFPMISSATTGAGSVTVEGTLNSTANTAFRLEFFSSAASDPSGFGEGEKFLGSAMVITDATCNAAFGPQSFPIGAGQIFVTATATRLEGFKVTAEMRFLLIRPLLVRQSSISGMSDNLVSDT